MINYLPLVVKNCIRNKRRTVSTVVGVARSLCLLETLMVLYRMTPEHQAHRLIVRDRISFANPAAALLPAAPSQGARRSGGDDLSVLRRRIQERHARRVIRH